MRTMMWWSAWTCSSSIKSNIQCQIGFKFKYSNIRERTWQHLKRNKCPFILIVFDSVRIFMCSSSPNTVCAPLTSCDASKNPFLRWHFLRYDTSSPPTQKVVTVWEHENCKLSAHSTNFNRATNMLNGNIKHNVTIFRSSYFTVVIWHFFLCVCLLFL